MTHPAIEAAYGRGLRDGTEKAIAESCLFIAALMKTLGQHRVEIPDLHLVTIDQHRLLISPMRESGVHIVELLPDAEPGDAPHGGGADGDGNGTPAGGYQHPEAYCLMTYRSDDGTEEEVIWNSRDGVTPFVVTLRSGKQATHIDWQNDPRVPDHKPKPGDRIFVDMTEQRAREIARRNAERWWNDPELGEQARAEFASVEAMAEVLYAWQPGLPDLIEVTE